MVRTESNQIVALSTSRNAGRIIVRIRIRLRTSRLENLRIRRRLARLRAPEAARTAVSGRVKSRARALAGHHAPPVAGADLEASRAHDIEVAYAAGVAAFAGALGGRYGNGEVVAVDEADIVEVLVVSEGDLGESGRRSTAGAGAEEGSTAVAGGAAASAVGVEGAAVAAPQATGPERWEAECVGLVGGQLEAAAGEDGLAGARLDSGPHGVGALVVESYGS